LHSRRPRHTTNTSAVLPSQSCAFTVISPLSSDVVTHRRTCASRRSSAACDTRCRYITRPSTSPHAP
jgi:hypothetical protein